MDAVQQTGVSPLKRMFLRVLVLDGMEQMNELEKLIVVCVGLDASVELDTLAARSMLYRAMQSRGRT
jgi:hypothetical protein